MHISSQSKNEVNSKLYKDKENEKEKEFKGKDKKSLSKKLFNEKKICKNFSNKKLNIKK